MNPDYITLTTRSPSLARALYALALSDERHEPMGRRLLGAEGLQAGKLFVGTWGDGRWLCSASGEAASGPWQLMKTEELVDGEWSISRVDLQMTVLVPDADAVIQELRPNRRYKSLLLTPIYDRGRTLYAGSAHSDKRLRIYNKSVQSNIQLGLGELLRVELQLRNAHADHALATARINTQDAFYGWWLEAVTWMAEGLRDVLPSTNMAHINIPDQESRSTYAAWIRRCVVPALMKARLEPEWEVVKRELQSAME